MGTVKSQPVGPLNGGPEGYHRTVMIDYFSHIPILHLALNYIFFVGDVIELAVLQSMTRAVQINLKQRIKSTINNEQMVISLKWIDKN